MSVWQVCIGKRFVIPATKQLVCLMSTYTSHPDTHAQKHTQQLSVKHFGLSPP